MQKKWLFVAVLLAVVVAATMCTGNKTEATAGSSIVGLTWQVPVEVADTPNPQIKDYYTLGWQSFIGLNWPADPKYRGEPDTTKSIGATGPFGNQLQTVWESWKEQYETFLAGGIKPAPWNLLGGLKDAKDTIKILRMFSKNDTSKVFDAFNEATGQPLIDEDSQFVRYEVRVDESEFTYFLINGYYNADSQKNAVSNKNFVGFPKGGDSLSNSLPVWARYGATEVKASWRVFKPGTPDSVKSRYLHKLAILVDQYGKYSQPVVVGLIGLHILRLTPFTHNTWYWASFEQADNLKLQPEYGGQLPAHPTFNTNPAVNYGDSGYSYQPQPVAYGKPLPPANPVGLSAPPFLKSDAGLDSINALYSKLLKGTPFQYYQLIGTVNPPVTLAYTDSGTFNGCGPKPQNYSPVVVNTPWLANSTLESYFVASNCVTCHISGYPQMYPKDCLQKTTGNYQVFSFLLHLAKSSVAKPEAVGFSAELLHKKLKRKL
jgi:hypothetical protein